MSNTQEKLRSDAYNKIAKEIKYREEYYYKNLDAAKEIGLKLDEHIGIEGLLEHFYPNLSPRLAKLNSLIKKIEKIDPQGVTPKMRQDLAHMQELSAQQEKELLEIKNLYEKLIAKWEKMHGQKANAVFPAKYTPKESKGAGGGNGGEKPPSSDDLLDPKRPLRKISPEEVTPEFLEEVKKRKDVKVWIGDLTNPQILEHLGFKSDRPVKMLFDGDALKHIEKRHGKGSPLVEKSKQPAVTHEDIASYPEIVNNADLMKVVKHNDLTTITIGKQTNGYAIVVEAVGKKNNRLTLKTMYKEHGKLEQGLDFKDGNYIRLPQR
ncbi:PBECR3 domain-containing polyvalent protein [Helicobacter labacensis]|uniref:PBECR3 domain-containing polyvalent protein n=1 Tax=Helicobacter labacensis TaxID=2316079 RepID=UPI000EB28ECD|nr:hypothetical protein [Helicobacter labacensis]